MKIFGYPKVSGNNHSCLSFKGHRALAVRRSAWKGSCKYSQGTKRKNPMHPNMAYENKYAVVVEW